MVEVRMGNVEGGLANVEGPQEIVDARLGNAQSPHLQGPLVTNSLMRPKTMPRSKEDFNLSLDVSRFSNSFNIVALAGSFFPPHLSHFNEIVLSPKS